MWENSYFAKMCAFWLSRVTPDTMHKKKNTPFPSLELKLPVPPTLNHPPPHPTPTPQPAHHIADFCVRLVLACQNNQSLAGLL